MIAFCTVLDNERSTTRSKGLSCASSRLPNTRSAITIKTYTRMGRRTFSITGAPAMKRSFHILVVESHSGINRFPVPSRVRSLRTALLAIMRGTGHPRHPFLIKQNQGAMFLQKLWRTVSSLLKRAHTPRCYNHLPGTQTFLGDSV